MNREEKQYFEEQLKPITIEVHDMRICLLGDAKNPEDQGLIGIVSLNTNFRKVASKALWLLFAGIIGLIFWIVRGTIQ